MLAPEIQRLQTLEFALHSAVDVEYVLPPVKPVPSGPFTMGSDMSHASGVRVSEFETPQHVITLPSFEIAIYPVTVAEYACAVRASALLEPDVPSVDREACGWQAQQLRPDCPVVYISWKGAVAYAQWLTHMTGRVWRLPTEAEWEKAARGTDGRMFPWGNLWDDARANTLEGGSGRLTPIGAYPAGASPYGIEDMAGNVYEWCHSHFGPYPYQADDGREESDSPFNRVMRGGCWDVSGWNARAIGRNQNDEPYEAFSFTGFRLVRDPATT